MAEADRHTRMVGPGAPASPDPIWTWSNALCVLRLLLLPGLLWLAWEGYPWGFLALLVVLLGMDAVDGRLARWLDQESVLGARIDSIADALMYGAIAVSVVWLRPGRWDDLLPFAVAVAVAYATSWGMSLVKFRRMPSYHTISAKIGWGLMGLGLAALLVLEWAWPLQVALGWVVLANLEAAAITLVLRRPERDVHTLWRAWGGGK